MKSDLEMHPLELYLQISTRAWPAPATLPGRAMAQLWLLRPLSRWLRFPLCWHPLLPSRQLWLLGSAATSLTNAASYMFCPWKHCFSSSVSHVYCSQRFSLSQTCPCHWLVLRLLHRPFDAGLQALSLPAQASVASPTGESLGLLATLSPLQMIQVPHSPGATSAVLGARVPHPHTQSYSAPYRADVVEMFTCRCQPHKSDWLWDTGF